MTFERGGFRCTYKIRKDGQIDIQTINGAEAYRVLNLYYNVPERKCSATVRPLLWKSNEYEGKRVKAICYDMNSAYGYGMLQPMPDTSKPPRRGIIKPGEIGFNEVSYNGDIEIQSLEPFFSGYSENIFKIIPSPLDKFVNKWYNVKKEAIDKVTKTKAKNMLVYSVGMLQRHNPFLRAAIIGQCNNYIKSLFDENTIYANTDSIVSLEPRPDLPIGEDIGQFKIEHDGDFAYIGFNHQWNDEIPAYRGIPKSWFKPGFDILKDKPPSFGNLIYFDRNTIQLRKAVNKWN